MRGVVQLAHANHALSGSKQIPWIAAHVAAAVSEIAHVAGHARSTPTFEAREVIVRQCGRNPGQLKPTFVSQRYNVLCGNAQYFILAFPLLQLHNVSVQRGDRLALNSINLRIDSGEHVAILGPNGSGKSTLIQLITRECYPLANECSSFQILGRSSWNIFELRSHLGIVSNDLMARCTRDITGRELVLSGFFGSIGIWPNHHVTEEMRAAAQSAMQRLDVAHLAGRWLDEVSSGEARRLLIARALIHNPSTLLLDEPATSLDLAALRELREHLSALARGGLSLLLVTHHLDEIIPEIERVVLLQKGRIFADGRKQEVLTSQQLSGLFGVPLEVSSAAGYYRAW
jgi:iron complex transport system ATP-binding protein